jgi:hypothetical protein
VADDITPAWAAQLAAFRRQVEAQQQKLGNAAPLVGEAGSAALARVRGEAHPLLEAVVGAYSGLCAPGFPVLEDNGIDGPGGSIGVRFSPHHAIYIALERVQAPKKAEPKPSGLAGALGVRLKRMPGQPLPPPDPHARYELVVLGLRWDDARGWVEVRRPLDPRWDAAMLQQHLCGYLLGFNFDIVAGLPGGE